MSAAPTDRSTPLSSAAVLRRRPPPDVEWVEVEGQAVVYDQSRDALHLLDPIATVVWHLLDGVTPLGRTGEELAEAVGRPAPEVLADVLRFAAQLEEMGLTERMRQ